MSCKESLTPSWDFEGKLIKGLFLYRDKAREHIGEVAGVGNGPKEASGEKKCNQNHVRMAGGVDSCFNSFIMDDAQRTSFV